MSFYWAGFLAADGSIRYRRAKVGKKKDGQISYSDRFEVSVSQIDKQHLNLFLKHIESEPRKLTEKQYWNKTEQLYKTLYSVNLYSKIMFNDLLNYGLCERKSYNLKLPEWLRNHKLVSHFLRGYFDGDGSVYYQRGVIWIEFVGTLAFIDSIRDILSSVSGSKAKPYVVNENTSRLVYSRRMASSIVDLLYRDACVFLPRKRELILQHNSV